MCHELKFHIDSQNAYSLDKDNQERRGNQEDNDQLIVEYEHLENDEELNLDELN
jgi:hypothetical protein